MDFLKDIDLSDCPICQGTGLLEEESGWCTYVACLDCGCRTAEVPFENKEQREKAARTVADLWNSGKVIFSGTGD
ncbi:MAG: Lar family restriction alleviation protein [Oscillospiraceae bacterium]|nr:Lar family restriction alleviation protein [Oscillospiraceae bacterium]